MIRCASRYTGFQATKHTVWRGIYKYHLSFKHRFYWGRIVFLVFFDEFRNARLAPIKYG
jgi:hypothetical protein